MNKPSVGRAVIFGELLFDCFPDGSVVLGGAPFSVAWHLHGFGHDPLLISRLGRDEHAEEILKKMTAWGLDTRGIQQDGHYPTGRVKITLDRGQPSFNILANQAYDYIDSSEAKQAVSAQTVALLYHGSLAVRNQTSLQALKMLRQRYADRIFVDINLRAPWWQAPLVDSLIANARWLKLNDNELHELAEDKTVAIEVQGKDYVQRYGLEQLILTLGEQGAMLISGEKILKGEPVLVSNVADTVGAGDAFSSIIIMAQLRGWAMAVAMSRALEFAALLCTQRGATIADRTVYKKLLEKWEVD